MNKSIYLIAAAALALVSCSQDDLMDNGMTGDNGNAIAFESYLGKSAQSRATVVTTESLKKEGFTVDAYYTGTDEFSSGATGSVFMKGTKVTYNEDKAAWTYSPLKYWPNNTGDKVSFFAYGPYGNTNIVRNTTTVSSIDFTVQNDVRNQVDFIYNNQADNSTINCTKPTVNDKVSFLFKHALSRIGFSVAAAVDETSVGTVKLDGNSRINVKKVALVDATSTVANLVDGPFYENGTLDMLEGKWSDLDGAQSFTLAGKNHFYRTVTDKDVENSTNDIDVVQLHKFNQSQRLLNDSAYVMIIPTDISENTDAKTSFKIYIEYDVITEDDDNADASKITNKILSENALDVKFEAGKAYNFNLILGMTSVKFDVDKVVDWENAGSIDEWLPGNEEEKTEVIENLTYSLNKNAFYISSAEDLTTMANLINNNKSYNVTGKASGSFKYASFLQIADIDMTNKTLVTVNDFYGSYNGQDYKIMNLTSNKSYGLIESNYGTVKNVHFTNANMTSAESGAVAANNNGNGKVIHCSYSGTFETSAGYVGAIVGRNGSDQSTDNNNCMVIGCYFSGTFKSSDTYSGAIVGNNRSIILGCYSAGVIKALGDPDELDSSKYGNNTIGGITCFSSHKDAILSGCYSTATFNANKMAYPILRYSTIVDVSKDISANYYTATCSNKEFSSNSDGYEPIFINDTTVTWALAVEAMNEAISDALKDLGCGNFKYVENTDEVTKEAWPYVLKEITDN